MLACLLAIAPAKLQLAERGEIERIASQAFDTLDGANQRKPVLGTIALRDVPWVQYFKGGYALHAAYWHDDFGRGRSHGCVNLSPIDARYAFFWSSPTMPEHWHGAYAGGPFEGGTTIYVHP